MKKIITVKEKNQMKKDLQSIDPLFSIERNLINVSGGGKEAFIVILHPCIRGTEEEIKEKNSRVNEIIRKYQDVSEFHPITKLGYAII